MLTLMHENSKFRIISFEFSPIIVTLEVGANAITWNPDQRLIHFMPIHYY